MDKEKCARKNISPWMNSTSQSPILGRANAGKCLDQRQIKSRPTLGQRIMQAISQIYGRIKLAKENAIHRQAILVK